VSLRGCVLVAIEGTHASGKTTLVHALTAHYRARGVLVNCTGEPARTSPFIEEIVVHGKGVFDLATEVDCSRRSCRPPCARPGTTTY
jgi:thymidylate kinase